MSLIKLYSKATNCYLPVSFSFLTLKGRYLLLNSWYLKWKKERRENVGTHDERNLYLIVKSIKIRGWIQYGSSLFSFLNPCPIPSPIRLSTIFSLIFFFSLFLFRCFSYCSLVFSLVSTFYLRKNFLILSEYSIQSRVEKRRRKRMF